MPYVDASLPFSGALTISRHCSSLGAQDAAPRAGRQARQLLLLLRERPDGLTDWELATHMAIERTSVTARRRPLCIGDEPWIVASGTRPGRTGVRNTTWSLSSDGLRGTTLMLEAERAAK